MSRYPKRKRKAASYLEADVDEADDDDDWGPAKEKKLVSVPKRARHVRKNKKTFAFLDLPGELRNKIYEFLLCSPTGDMWIGEQAVSKTNPRKRANFRLGQFNSVIDNRRLLATSSLNFAILRVSKRINTEAMSILYGQKFHFERVEAMQTFLLRVSPAAVGLLRDINCGELVSSLDRKLLPVVFTLLRPAVRLEHLRVENLAYCQCRTLTTQLPKTPGQADMTAATWDRIVAQHYAMEVYAHMYPYIEASLRNNGVEGTMQILDLFGDLFTTGPQARDYGLISYGSFSFKAPNNAVWNESQKHDPSRKRASAIRAAMGEELARLVADNSVRA